MTTTIRSPTATPPALALDARRHARWLLVCRAYARWLRVRSEGVSYVPSTGPVVLVGNHAGLRSLDHMAVQALVADGRGRPVRGLAHRSVEQLPLVGTAHTAYAGAVIGHRDTAVELLRAGEVVAVYPEGGSSTDKRFRERDRVLPRPAWSDGWTRVALASDAVIVPVGTSGFEAAVPTLWRSRTLGRLWRLDGDYPVSPQTVPTLTVPWLAGPLPFPVRCAVVFGAPVRAHELLGRPARGAADRAAVSEAVRDRVQALVAEAGRRRRSAVRRRKRHGPRSAGRDRRP